MAKASLLKELMVGVIQGEVGKEVVVLVEAILILKQFGWLENE